MEENRQERIGYEQRLNYINAASGDIRSAKDIRLYGMARWFSDLYRDNMSGIAGLSGTDRFRLRILSSILAWWQGFPPGLELSFPRYRS